MTLLAVTTPTVAFRNKDQARRVARVCNEYAAKLRADFPGWFGMLATMPMPYPDDTLREMAYAYESLKTDGICLMTSYGDRWLGDPGFRPIMQELNRRKAVVHVHPSAAHCRTNVVPNIPASLIEYSTDATHTLASLIFTGTSARFKDIQFVFSHRGGTMPYLIERFNNLPNSDRRYSSFTSQGVLAEITRFYYDTAIITHPAPLSALTHLVPTSQLVLGSDFPFRRATASVKGLANFFDAGEMKQIDYENALGLLPHLRMT